MSFVYGSTLSYYLKKNQIDKHLSLELVKLIDEFKRLHFTKLDMRLGHIFLQPDETIKVIDPRGSYEIILKWQPYDLLLICVSEISNKSYGCHLYFIKKI